MIKKALIELIFEAASIERWNDHIRPSRGFSELDKQSHKMVYAYVLAKLDGKVDWLKLVEGGVFEFFHRLVITDIKPPIYHRLMEEKGDELNRWALNSVKPLVQNVPKGFYEKMEKYFTDPEYAKREKSILEAAHYLSTKWEFEIIYNMCRNYYRIDTTKAEIDDKLNSFSELECLREYNLNTKLCGFTNLLGELRFQQRWSRSPRIPETSVCGHMLIVAMLSYLCSCETEACDERIVNNFLGGLFHDIPEVLTRDIVSPVKNSVEGLDDLIKDIEREQMDTIIYPLLPEEWRSQIFYYTNDEFENKIIKDGEVKILPFDEINEKYNDGAYYPIDGELIRGCDHLSACIEAYFSHSYGVTTNTLVVGNHSLCQRYENRFICNIDFGSMFDYFRI